MQIVQVYLGEALLAEFPDCILIRPTEWWCYICPRGNDHRLEKTELMKIAVMVIPTVKYNLPPTYR